MRHEVPATFSSARLREALIKGKTGSLNLFRQSSREVRFETPDLRSVLKALPGRAELNSGGSVTRQRLYEAMMGQGQVGALRMGAFQETTRVPQLAGRRFAEALTFTTRWTPTFTVSAATSTL